MAEPTFRRGKEHIERAASRGGDYTKTDFISWSDGETKTLRFLHDTDGVITMWTHEFIKGADNKPHSFVCRRDIFDEPCELCDTMEDSRRRELGYGVAVLRLKVTDEQGTVTGFSDAIKEDERTKKKVPMVGVVQRGHRNFWKRLIAVERREGPLYTFDIDIEREGGDTETQYHPWANPVVEISNLFPDMKCPKCGWAAPLGKGFNGAKCLSPEHKDEDPPELEGTPGRYDKYVPSLEDMLARMGSEPYYKRFLHGESEGGKASSNGKSEGKPQAEQTLDKSEFDRLREERERVTSEGYE